MSVMRCLILLGLELLVGCGGAAHRGVADGRLLAQNQEAAVKAPEAQGRAAPARKIIYVATLELIVDDLDRAEAAVTQLVQEQGAYVAKSEVRDASGSQRTGVWTVRVPVEHFSAFMKAAGKLGELRHSGVDSDDVTDRYYDLEAHLKNNQVEEEGLRTLLLEKSANGKLDEVLTVRREIRTIRGEIDAQLGQVQRWNKDAAFATITLSLHERKDAPTHPAPLTLREEVGRTFASSLGLLGRFGRGLLLIAVALIPWLPVSAVVIVPFWLKSRR